MSYFTKVTLYCILSISLAYGAPHENWMRALSSDIADKSLNEIVIPGTHDSATNLISFSSKVAQEQDVPHWLNKLRYIGVGFIPTGVIAKWSKTQNRTIKQQLMDGIRYLDLRVVYRDSNKAYYTVHGLYGEKIDDVLRQVKEFADRHPREIIILDFNHLYNMKPKEGNSRNKGLINKIKNAFGDKLAPNTFGPKTKIGDFWKEGYQIIVLYGNNRSVQENDFLWSQKQISSPWPNKQSIKELKPVLDKELENWNGEDNKDRLFVLQCILTPNGKTIKSAFVPFSKAPKNIKAFTNPVKVNIKNWLNEWQGKDYGMNIILLDFFDDPTIINQIIDLNREDQNNSDDDQ